MLAAFTEASTKQWSGVCACGRESLVCELLWLMCFLSVTQLFLAVNLVSVDAESFSCYCDSMFLISLDCFIGNLTFVSWTRHCQWSWTSDRQARVDRCMSRYTALELHMLRRYDITPPRAVRKTIFSLQLWRPCLQRRHVQWQEQQTGISHSVPIDIDTETVSCSLLNACSVGNKSALSCWIIADSHTDVLLMTETWHKNAESVSLKWVMPGRYKCIYVARPLAPHHVYSAKLISWTLPPRPQSSADKTATVFRCRTLLVFILLIRQKLLRGRWRCFL